MEAKRTGASCGGYENWSHMWRLRGLEPHVEAKRTGATCGG